MKCNVPALRAIFQLTARRRPKETEGKRIMTRKTINGPSVRCDHSPLAGRLEGLPRVVFPVGLLVVNLMCLLSPLSQGKGKKETEEEDTR